MVFIKCLSLLIRKPWCWVNHQGEDDVNDRPRSGCCHSRARAAQHGHLGGKKGWYSYHLDNLVSTPVLELTVYWPQTHRLLSGSLSQINPLTQSQLLNSLSGHEKREQYQNGNITDMQCPAPCPRCSTNHKATWHWFQAFSWLADSRGTWHAGPRETQHKSINLSILPLQEKKHIHFTWSHVTTCEIMILWN